MSQAGSGAARPHWSSRFAFIMVASGFAVGLGNIWRFPYLVGENGGSAFILVYLACAFGIGAPLIMAELMIGRRGRADVIGSIQNVASEAGVSTGWGRVGGLALVATFAILASYMVIAGWTLDYMLQAASGALAGQGAQQSAAAYEGLMADPLRLGFWSACVVAITAFAVGRGITGGIEKAARFLMPALFLGMIALAVYAAVVGDIERAIAFLFTPDFSRIDADVVLVAVGQAFFSVGVGFGTMISFGAYLDRNTSISGTAMNIVAADTAVALIAGLAVFPLVFGFGLPPGSGPGLVFVSLPVAFGILPGGSLVALFFFFLLFAAAITSCIGLFEPLVSWVSERRGLSRRLAVWLSAALVWVAGFATILSLNHWQDIHPAAWLGMQSQSTIFDLQDFLAVNILLPLGALLTAIFVGWRCRPSVWRDEAIADPSWAISLWSFAIRYLIPLAIGGIFASAFIG